MKPGNFIENSFSLRTTDTALIIEANIPKQEITVDQAYECVMMFLKAIERIKKPQFPHLDQFKTFTQE